MTSFVTFASFAAPSHAENVKPLSAGADGTATEPPCATSTRESTVPFRRRNVTVWATPCAAQATAQKRRQMFFIAA